MDWGSMENLSSTNSRQINLLRYCWGSIDGKNTSMDQIAIGQADPFSMDREFVEKLLRQILESFDGSKKR